MTTAHNDKQQAEVREAHPILYRSWPSGLSLMEDLRVIEVQHSYQAVAISPIITKFSFPPRSPLPHHQEKLYQKQAEAVRLFCVKWLVPGLSENWKCLHRYPQRGRLNGNLILARTLPFTLPWSPNLHSCPLHLGHSILGHPLHDP